jgi:hypothetical protein
MSEHNDLHVLRKMVVVVALAGLAFGAAALGQLIVTNNAGVSAGITSIVYSQAVNSVNVSFAVVDPIGTNVTKFIIQSSPDLQTWTNLTQTITVTGSVPGGASDPASSQTRFYRMLLLNFR